jgi:hypothetical protein
MKLFRGGACTRQRRFPEEKAWRALIGGPAGVAYAEQARSEGAEG